MTSLETGETVPSLQLGIPAMSTIMILDDDHGGVFCFEEHEAEITESVGTFELKVIKTSSYTAFNCMSLAEARFLIGSHKN
jgi:hypothetical protein